MLFLDPQSNLLLLMDLLLETSPSPQQQKSSWSTPLTFSDPDIVQLAKANINVNIDLILHRFKIVYFLSVRANMHVHICVISCSCTQSKYGRLQHLQYQPRENENIISLFPIFHLYCIYTSFNASSHSLLLINQVITFLIYLIFSRLGSRDRISGSIQTFSSSVTLKSFLTQNFLKP